MKMPRFRWTHPWCWSWGSYGACSGGCTGAGSHDSTAPRNGRPSRAPPGSIWNYNETQWYHKNIGRSFMYFGGVDSTLLSEMSWGKGVWVKTRDCCSPLVRHKIFCEVLQWVELIHIWSEEKTDNVTWSIRERGSVGLGSCQVSSGSPWMYLITCVVVF